MRRRCACWRRRSLRVGGAAALLGKLAVAPQGGGGARRGDEGARRRRGLVGEALDVALSAVEQRRRNVEMARLVGLRRLGPIARQRRQRMAHAQQLRRLGDDCGRFRPNAQQRFVGRPHALARRVALGGQQPLGDEGVDQRAPFGPAGFEGCAVERAEIGVGAPVTGSAAMSRTRPTIRFGNSAWAFGSRPARASSAASVIAAPMPR